MDKPSDSMDFIGLLRGTPEERKKGVRLLFELLFIRQYAVYWYRRYSPRITNMYPEWNDLYVVVVLEIVKEVDEGRGPRKHLKAYTSGLCRNLCEKAMREIKVDEVFDNALSDLLEDGADITLKDWVEGILKSMECKCETLLRWRYLQDPAVRERGELAELLKEECGTAYSPTAIPVHLHDCREKFRRFSQDNPFNFDDSNR